MSESMVGVRRVLAIDTATDAVVTGVASVDAAGEIRVLADRTVLDHRRHAELLTTLIAEALTQAGVASSDLDAVVVGCGPGPFTGLRVGMATAAGFADALDIPVYGVCTLDALAADTARQRPSASSILVVTDARRREVYWATYRDGQRQHGPQVCAPAAVAELAGAGISGLDAVGVDAFDAVAGSETHLAAVGWTGQSPSLITPTVAGLALAASAVVVDGAPPGPLTPLYLRRPDAVERKDQGLKQNHGVSQEQGDRGTQVSGR
ncbi:MAG: tRNA (adenosine(37)-N6)-threonylcarbamoyltransferase complex dimerization subunit type 1 TsaB [Gordonia sp. (in: high G+C Gram-positive bacteria)]